MKQLKKFFRTFLGLSSLICTISSYAQTSSVDTLGHSSLMDSVEVSLLTCSPHEEIYSLYGHTAIRWHDPKNGEDIAFNWGVFDFRKPYFVPRFVFGLTDYELGAYPFHLFQKEYEYYGSSVIEQVLNLTAEEKLAVKKALTENMKPENKVYRYNYFYDNCSLRPMTLIEKSISGKVEYQPHTDEAPSYREMVHHCVRNHPWAAFGNDLLLGVKADWKTTQREQAFLPENLMYDFDHATIYANGNYRPLVKERRVAVKPGVQIIEEDFPLSPTACALILLAVSAAICVAERRRHKTFVWWDVLLMTIQGLAGIILFLMLFSQHPTTSTNLQILLLNPLPLFYIPSVVRRRQTRWWIILASMVVLFCIGAIFQDYAEGMLIVALSLLLRAINGIYIKNDKRE